MELRPEQWTKKLFFHLTDMTILNTYLIHKSCGGKMMHKVFREILVCKLIFHSQEGDVTASGTSRGRPSPAASQLSRLEVKHSQHWPSKGKQRRCCMCSLQKQTRSVLYFCSKCDVGLCVVNCFKKWHMHVNFGSLDRKICVYCGGLRQIISLYSMYRKHLPCK
jgi:hypothetical protein